MRDEKLAADAVAELTELQKKRDLESAHIQADEVLTVLLRRLGYEDVSDAFEKIDKWYA